MRKYNKGEWSEVYAFCKLLKDGRIYAADENVDKLEDIYFPIIKIIREEIQNQVMDYRPGETVRIYQNDQFLNEFPTSELINYSQLLFNKIYAGSDTESGAFSIPELEEFLKTIQVTRIKVPARDKTDITLQIHDIYTGYSPVIGFSVKSDVGSPPTLLNASQNTRIQYKIDGLSLSQMEEINAINKTVERDYMKLRMRRLFELATNVQFHQFLDETFEDNLVMIDSLLPQIYGDMVLLHYQMIDDKIYDIESLTNLLQQLNKMNYRRSDIYRYKIKKMLSASALGMTPGKPWNGLDAASGGYIIIKKDGDVLCYHLYNRNHFEEYLIHNTRIDRPSASKTDYGYIYEENNQMYINLNVQIRFKAIPTDRN